MGAFLDIVGGLANVGSTIAGTVDSIKTNKENLALQKDNLAYQKDLQNTIFEREDNAVQRRVADLKAAGLSPTLAAGSSAGAGSVVSTSAPQRKNNLEALSSLASVKTLLAQQQRAQTEADIARQQLEMSKEQLKQVKMDNYYYDHNNIAPVESKMGWQQQFTNFLIGILNDWRYRSSEGSRNVLDRAFTNVKSSIGHSLDLLNIYRPNLTKTKSKSRVIHGGSGRSF